MKKLILAAAIIAFSVSPALAEHGWGGHGWGGGLGYHGGWNYHGGGGWHDHDGGGLGGLLGGLIGGLIGSQVAPPPPMCRDYYGRPFYCE